LQGSFYSEYGKRGFDIVASLIGLLVLLPLLLLVAIAIRLDSPGSSFFLQARTARSGRRFRIIKFRTMRASTSAVAPLITASGDSRVTRLGRLLRKSKVDELPQLFNVLRGDMSLVGPRPEVPKYTVLFTERQKAVLLARPGITGPAAIQCVNEEELLAKQEDPESYYLNSLLPAKLEMDLLYCNSISFQKDLHYISQTLGKLLGRSRDSLETRLQERAESAEELS